MGNAIFESNYPVSQYGFVNKNGLSEMIIDFNYVDYETMLPLHHHHMLEISLFCEGAGRYLIGDREYDIRTGDIFVINSTEPHRIALDKGESVKNLVIHFEPSFLWSFYEQTESIGLTELFLARNGSRSNRLDRSNPHSTELIDLFHRIRKTFETPPRYLKLTVKILMETLFVTILNNYDLHTEAEPVYELTRQDIFNIDEVLKYINNHLSDHLTLNELSEIACLSPAYFSSIFRRYSGTTLFQHITAKRIDLANNLIASGNLSFSEIARQCGFNSSTSFNKAFKRVNGVTPSEFRRMTQMRNFTA